ncbi:hypothetical protein JYT16_01640, partial [Gemmatimonas aurantiaca]|nr:hypothetical protein [Gemmatimonas aurantiaca]
MSENASKESPTRKKMLTINDDDRLRYFGFDVGPEKIGEFFKDKPEEAKLVAHVQEKREQNDVLRDTSNFREERISQTERYTIIGACAVVILSFFLPFTPLIGGYVETRTEVKLTTSGSETTEVSETSEATAGDETAAITVAGSGETGDAVDGDGEEANASADDNVEDAG